VSATDWLTLGLATGLRGNQLAALLDRFGSAAGAVAAAPSDLRAMGLKRRTIEDIVAPDHRALARCNDWLACTDHRVVTWTDPEYPHLLKSIYDPPVLLYVRGDADILNLPQLAIVGSRNATPGGCATARRFSAHLGQAGLCITSGLAIGIDACAHRGALDAGAATIAVCATGPDETYPARHAKLSDAVARGGAVVTEFPPGSPPRRAQFPQRNRLISGMSVGTLVVEAGLRSGALITARFASEQGREVFAVPGSIHSPTARGSHRLIRNGAKLVESVHDIIEELPAILGRVGECVEQNTAGREPRMPMNGDPEYQRLLEFIGWDPVTVDQLVNSSGLTPEEVSSMLLILELEECVEPLAGGYYQQREEGPKR